MSRYLEKYVGYMQAARAAADSEPNAHRKAILENYCQHAAFEFSNRDEEILKPERTVANPLYRIKRHGAELAVYEGLAAVQGYYDAVNREVIMLNDEQLMVNDWGVSSYSTLVRFVSGAQLVAEGNAGAFEPDCIYVQSSPLAMFWPYNSDAKLLGEDVFELDRPIIEKPAGHDVVTLAMRIEATRPFLPPAYR
jgi:hypothetical protein